MLHWSLIFLVIALVAAILGFGGLAAMTDFDKPRCREASRPVGPLGPVAFRAPSAFGGARLECEIKLRPTRGRKEYGR